MPVTALEDLQADIEFLQSALGDTRVRIRRVKAKILADGLVPFCQGIIGTVLVYDQTDRSKTLHLKVQVEFVPADKRKLFTRGTLLDMRGMVSLPQLEGDPAEFRVATFADIDLRDNGLGPWLDSGKPRESTSKTDAAERDNMKTTAFAASPAPIVIAPKAAPANTPTRPPKASDSSSTPTVMDVPGTDLKKLKGIVMDDFVADASAGVHVGSVYVKDLRSHVAVSVHGATANGVAGFKEGRFIEMRGVLYEEEGLMRIDVMWPQIARSGRLPAFVQSAAPPAVLRAYAADLKSESKGLKLVTGKVVAEGEQRGAHACFDVFVKDSSNKCVLTVAVVGDLRDVQTSEIIEKEVDFKGSKVLESPSITSLNKNFDFMSTDLPPGKTLAVSTESKATAVAAIDDDITVVGAGNNVPSCVAAFKQEKLVDIANDPAFSMLQSGGGQLPLNSCRPSDGVFQQPKMPPLKPRSTRKSKPTGSELSETPTKKNMSSTAKTRRGNNWLQDLGDLKDAEAAKGDAEKCAVENNEEDSSSTNNTFDDACSNLSTASNVTGSWMWLLANNNVKLCSGNRHVDFSAFIDDEAKEVNRRGGLEAEDREELG